MSRIAFAWVLIVLAACQRDAPAAGAAAGKERGDCRANKTCDPGLLCLSNLCVRPPPADCKAIGETLASIDLGNYAPVEERAPVVAKYAAACEAAYVSKEEGACIDKAKDKWTASQCAPRMFPELAASAGTGDCARIAAKIRAAMGPQAQSFQNDPKMAKWFDTTIQVIQQSCEQDQWPEPLKRCALAADANNGVNALQNCNQQMPPALQQKLQDRMAAAMKTLSP